MFCLPAVKKIFTYIHNWPLQPFSQDYGLASHTTHVFCFNFICERRDLSLTLAPNDRFLRNFFMTGLFTLRVFARNLLSGNRRRNIVFSWFLLMPDLGYEPWPKHYLLEYGDFNKSLELNILMN